METTVENAVIDLDRRPFATIELGKEPTALRIFPEFVYEIENVGKEVVTLKSGADVLPLRPGVSKVIGGSGVPKAKNERLHGVLMIEGEGGSVSILRRG